MFEIPRLRDSACTDPPENVVLPVTCWSVGAPSCPPKRVGLHYPTRFGQRLFTCAICPSRKSFTFDPTSWNLIKQSVHQGLAVEDHFGCCQICPHKPHGWRSHLALITIVSIVSSHGHVVVNNQLQDCIGKRKLVLTASEQVPIVISFIREHGWREFLNWLLAGA